MKNRRLAILAKHNKGVLMDIKEARKQIDSIDAVLVAEFEKRLSLIKEIGKYKDEHHYP